MAGRDGTIYVIRNLINGKCYVGQTVNIRQRFAYYRSSLRVKECRRPIESAVCKYGWASLQKYVFDGVPLFLLDDIERQLIQRLRSIVPDGYNLDSGGNSLKQQHPDSLRKRSLALSGEKHPLFGTHLSYEQRTHLSEVWAGRRLSAETRLKIGDANRGRMRTPQWRERLSESLKGKMAGAKNHKSKPVICVETNQIFASIRQAALSIGIQSSHISECCRGALRTHGKFHWAFVGEEVDLGRRAN